MKLSEYTKGVLAACAASVLAAIITGGVAMYSDLNANTLHRMKAEEVLSDVHESVIRIEERQKVIIKQLDTK